MEKRLRLGSMSRALRILMVTLLALLVVLIALPFALDTQSGREWAARRLAGFSLANGISLHVTRISGNLWGRATLEGVELHDQDGRFARAPRVLLDWTPRALINNRFEAAELIIPDATLERLPHLKPVSDPRILPDIDIRISKLELGKLVVAKGVAGPERLLSAKSRLDLHAGRALVDLDAVVSAGDTLALHLDAEPDRDKFALNAKLAAPAGGLVATLAGLKAPLVATATGRGRWRDWTGQLSASLGTAPLADLALAGKAGTLQARGRIDPVPLLGGATQEALAGGLSVVADMVPEGDLTRLKLTLDGKQFTGRLSGRIDRAEERWTEAEARLSLAEGSALAKNWGIDGGLLTARLAGPLLAPIIDARLLAKRLALPGGLALNGLSVAGIVDLNEAGLSAPLVATASGLTGLPDTLTPLAGKWRAEGRLAYAKGQLQANDLKLASGPLAARIGLSFVPATSAWGLTAGGNVRGWALPQLGLADATFRANLKPGANQSVIGIGDFRVVAPRPPASGLTRLTGGGITLGGRFALLPGLAVALSDLALSSPKLAAAGRAGWAKGRFTLASTGSSLDWGPFALDGEGTAAAPHFTARLAKPGYGLTAVAARIDPAGDGWRVDGDAQSGLGPVSLKADVSLSPVLRIDVERLAAADFVASGRLDQSAAGPFAGTLALAGKGLTGSAKLSAAGAVQLAELAVAGDSLNLPLATPITVDRLRLAARVLLPASGPDIDAALDLAGLERGNLAVEKATGTLQMKGGSGTASLTLAGNSGEAFNLAFTGTIAPDRWQISGGGDYDGRAAKLAGPAVITRDTAGWHLAPVTLTSALGNAEVAVDWGTTKRLNARLDKVSLQMVGLAYPTLNLAGRVSGTLALAQTGDAAPTGTAALRLNGLSRSNITSTSTPIDVGLNAALGAGGTVMRAVIVRAGKVEGRAQARLGPIPSGDADLKSRLFAASVTGELR